MAEGVTQGALSFLVVSTLVLAFGYKRMRGREEITAKMWAGSFLVSLVLTVLMGGAIYAPK